MVGLPCSGKTTLAKKLESEQNALRLTPDDWQRRLFGQDTTHPKHDERHTKIEDLLWSVAASALSLGTNVILDFGLWTRSERDDYRERGAAIGATTCIHFLDVSHDELFARLQIRNEGAVDEVTYIPPKLLQRWLSAFQIPDCTELGLNVR